MTTNPTARTDTCGTVRASLFYGAPILSESGACILPGRHKGDHQDARGARWYRIPLVGGMDLCGEEQALPLAHKPTWSAEPSFLSPFCVLGQHPRCLDSEPRDTGVPGVHYLVCTCACHHPAPPSRGSS